MKALFITAGDENWASSRLRGYWPAKYLKDSAVLQIDTIRELPQAEAYVFQKSINLAMVSEAHNRGAKVYWDFCDPLWWWSPTETKTVLACVDGAIFSNLDLMLEFQEFSAECKINMPAWCIPDRLDLEHYPIRRVHSQIKPVRLIWFGLSVNRMGILGALNALERLACNGYSIEMTIYDDQPNNVLEIQASFPIYQCRWTLGHENAVIASHDIAILPPYPGDWGKVKSNNKMLTAWACGLPVDTGDYRSLVGLVESADLRASVANMGLQVLYTQYDIAFSVTEWEQILCSK